VVLVEVEIEAMGIALLKGNAAVYMAGVALDGHIVAKMAREAVWGFAKVMGPA